MLEFDYNLSKLKGRNFYSFQLKNPLTNVKLRYFFVFAIFIILNAKRRKLNIIFCEIM